MVPTLIGGTTGLYLFFRANSAIKEGRDILALVWCLIGATLIDVAFNMDREFLAAVVRALN